MLAGGFLLSWPAFMASVAMLAHSGYSKLICILLPSPLAIVGFVCAILVPMPLRPFRPWRMTAAVFVFTLYGAVLVKLLRHVFPLEAG